ncbi:hypothetical protein INR49_028772 [Caranx melampygus]|nr:hypothetical protein INR49_028772 [Caranx melampygus]
MYHRPYALGGNAASVQSVTPHEWNAALRGCRCNPGVVGRSRNVPCSCLRHISGIPVPNSASHSCGARTTRG